MSRAQYSGRLPRASRNPPSPGTSGIIRTHLFGGGVLFQRKPGTSHLRRSVSDDWIAAIPREKARVFDAVVQRWESTYAMMSVSLDDAISVRSRGELVCARQYVAMSADLLAQLAAELIGACRCLSDRGRLLNNLPRVQPLQAEFFRGETARAAASWNDFLHHVLFAERSRFFQKLRILSETLENLIREFDAAAEDVFAGLSVRPGRSWDALECLHYDFATCLRESEILLKSFLRALPAEQVAEFASDLSAAPSIDRVRAKPGTRVRAFRASA